MRNLKRVLSLTLASVMLLGMMVVGSSAAGYSDVDEEDNVEAIEVLQAVEVMVGDDRGFGPDRPVTRNEMAVVMGKLLNLDYNYYVSTCPFNDVANWARGWVGACYANGIVSGRGNGIYDGESTVTAIEAASMMMRALGYFKNIEDYADGFATVTVRQGSQIGIFNGVGTDATSPMTRNQVAQMALNALRSDMVDFTGTPAINANGISVGYRAEYTPRTSTLAKYQAIERRSSDVSGDSNHRGQYYVQLGEELYDGDLRLNDGATDDFGRPSRYWEYDGKAIGTYAKTELIRAEYTEAVSGRDLYDLLGSDLLNEKVWSLDVAIDGIDDYDIDNALFNGTSLNRNNKATVGNTGNGVLTQVFVDSDKHEITIAIINTYLARATADYDTRKEVLSLDVYGIKEKTGFKDNYVKTITADPDKDDFKVSIDDFDVADVKKDDSFLVTVADGAVQSMKAVAPMSAVEISSFQSRKPADRGSGNLTTGGTKYNFADTAEYENACLKAYTGSNNSSIINLKDLTYDVYLDAYGYVIGVVEVDKPTNYLFITGVNGGKNYLASTTLEAGAIFLDGTMEVIKINQGDSTFTTALAGDHSDSRINKWFTYTKDNKGVYTVEEVELDAGANKKGQSHITWEDTDNDSKIEANRTINKKNIYMSTVTETLDDTATTNALAYGNDKSVYISADIDRIITDSAQSDVDIVISGVNSVTTGIDNVDIKAMTEAEATTARPTPASPALTAGDVSHGVYTLYDADGWIIAMVIVGEDNGSNSTFAYVHNESVAQEYLMSDKTYKWERTVVIDGVEATLTEVNDTRISLLEKMDENKWYRVRTNNDGNVTAILGSPNGDSTLDSDTDVGNKFGDWNLDDDSVPTAYNVDYDGSAGGKTLVGSFTEPGVETVLYHEAFTNKVPSADGHSLYVEQGTNSGLRFAKDVKVVLDQINARKRETYFGEGQDDLKGFLDDLHPSNEAGTAWSYEVSAILKGGVADVIIIKDLTPDGNAGETPITGEKIDGLWINLTDTSGLEITGVTTKDTAPSEEGTVGGIIDALTKAGYSFDDSIEGGAVQYNSTSSKWEFNVYKTMGGVKVGRQWTWDKTPAATNGVSMTVNGTPVVVAPASNTWTKVATELNITEVGKWTKLSDGTYEAESAGTKIADGAKAELGYYKVTKPANSTKSTLTYSVSAPAATTYVKKGAEVTLTFNITGTAGATAAQSITTVAANATIKEAAGALTAAAGGNAAGLTSVAVADNHTITVTPKDTATASNATYTVTLVVVGADDVVITLPSD